MILGIIGMGIAGRALASSAHLAGYQQVLTYDSKNSPQNNTLQNCKGIDVLCLSAGIDLKACQDAFILDLCKQAEQAGVPIVNDVELFYRHFQPNTIAVTGSYGKSTTVSMVSFLLDYLNIKHSLRGNIGVPVWADPLETKLLVLEVSNNQLENLTSLQAKVGVVLNVFAHHLARYSGVNEYVQVKSKLLAMSDLKIIGNYSLSASLFNKYPDAIPLDKVEGQAADDLNAQAACIAVCSYLNNLDRFEELFDLALDKFIPLEHRCEQFLVKGNVVFVNNSKATDVEPVLETIKKFACENTKLVLVCGGLWDQAVKENWCALEAYLEKVDCLLLFGQAREELYGMFEGKVDACEKCESFEEMCAKAVSVSMQLGESFKVFVLFAPGAQSFDEFKNFEERGVLFKKLVLAAS